MNKTLLAPGSRGFTLVELMIVVAIFAGVSMGGYTIYRVQQSSYLMQEQLVEMQQNVRAFLYFIEKDLRMAGYDVYKTHEAGFVTAKPYEVVFSADVGRPRTDTTHCSGEGCDSMPDGEIIDSPCDDCVTETFRYSLSSKTGAPTPGETGKVPAGKTTTVTKTFNGSTSTNEQEVVDGVEALEFLYNLNDGTSKTGGTGEELTAADLENIRSVTVSLLMRTRNILTGTTDTRHYFSASGKDWGVPNDPYLRSLVITNIQCRNMSLQKQQ